VELHDIRKITIVGAGTMGGGCAQVFAGAGYPVVLQSRTRATLDKAMATIRADLLFLAERGVGRMEDVESTVGRITITQDLEEAVGDADFVLENAAENLELKQDLFRRMDQVVRPTTILATNTSVMSITEIASKSEGRDRIIGTHWWNPPYLLPLVEVVQTKDSAPEVIDVTMELMRKIGKRPVFVKKDVPGFVANRLQHALFREAISIVEHGIADAATVDEAIKASWAMRLPVLAPMEGMDYGGLDLILAIHDYIFKHLEDSHAPSPYLREKVGKGELGFKAGGTGFLTWTPEQMKDLRRNLLDYLAQTVASSATRPAEPNGAAARI
jgi:3-hydroxybutyryl-CoA dehydrogenase